MREAIYARRSQDDLRGSHRRAALWLTQAPGTDPLTIAKHWSQAGEHQKAAPWLLAAAERSLRGGQLASALAQAREGVTSLGSAAVDSDAVVRTSLHSVAALARYHTGDVAGACDESSAALACAERGSPGWLRAAAIEITARGQRGDNESVAAMVRQLVVLEPPDAHTTMLLGECLGRTVTQLSFALTSTAEDALRRLDELTARIVTPSATLATWRARAHVAVAFRIGDLEAAIRFSQEVMAACNEVADFGTRTHAAIALTNLLRAVGELENAEDYANHAIAIAERAGSAYFTHWARFARAKVLYELQRFAEARQALLQVAEAVSASPRMAAGALIYASLTSLSLDDASSALSLATRAAALSSAPAITAGSLACQARALLAAGEPATALPLSRQALVTLEAHVTLEEFEVLVRCVAAEALAAAGARDEALRTLQACAASIERQAAKLSSPFRRDGFRSRLLEHARVMRLLRDWTGNTEGSTS